MAGLHKYKREVFYRLSPAYLCFKLLLAAFLAAIINPAYAQFSRSLQVDPTRSSVEFPSPIPGMNNYFITIQPTKLSLVGNLAIQSSSPQQMRWVSSEISTNPSAVQAIVTMNGTQVGNATVSETQYNCSTTSSFPLASYGSFSIPPDSLQVITTIGSIEGEVSTFKAQLREVVLATGSQTFAGSIGSVVLSLGSSNRISARNLAWSIDMPSQLKNSLPIFTGNYSTNGPLSAQSAPPANTGGAIVTIFAT